MRRSEWHAIWMESPLPRILVAECLQEISSFNPVPSRYGSRPRAPRVGNDEPPGRLRQGADAPGLGQSADSTMSGWMTAMPE